MTGVTTWLVILSFSYALLYYKAKPRYIHNIPFVTVVPNIPFGGTIATLLNLFRFDKELVKGYESHNRKGLPFQVSTSDFYTTVAPLSWLPELKKDAKCFSLHGANEIMTCQEYTFLSEHSFDYYGQLHTPLIKAHMVPAIGRQIPSLVKEISDSLDRHWGPGIDWTSLALHDKMTEVVAPIWTRLLLGARYNKDEVYLKAACDYSMSTSIWSFILNLTPKFLQPFVYRRSSLPRIQRTVTSYVRKAADELTAEYEAAGLLGDRARALVPDDGLSTMIKLSRMLEIPLDDNRLSFFGLSLNHAGIPTTAAISTQLLYDLAARPRYVELLREEFELHFTGEWSTELLRKLVKMDSFLKESGRLNQLLFAASNRQIVPKEGYTFSSGHTLPQGAFLSIPAVAVHRDPQIYGPNPDEFDGERFLGKGSFVDASDDYHVFGWGKSMCPGRFFSHTVIKILLAHVLCRYDIKPMERPKNLQFGNFCAPHISAKLEVRRRMGNLKVLL